MATQALQAFSPRMYRARPAPAPTTAVLMESDAIVLYPPVCPESRRSVTVTSESGYPDWVMPAVKSLVGLQQLAENWNGYGASAVKEAAIVSALRTLVELLESESPAPSIVPLADGGIQLEWHRQGRHLEIELPTDDTASYYYYEDDTEVEHEGPVAGSQEQIGQLLSEMN